MTGRKTFSGDVRSSGYLLLALLILLAAAFLRLFQLPHYPPGPHYDEGAYLLITRAIAFGGARFFPIVEAYQGREVLYMYLSAPFLHLIKDDIFTLRLVSASANLITVAATIALGRSMFRGQRGLIVGLTAGALIALSFPQFWLARQAFRAVTLPLMQALALLLLWRGLRARNGWGWLIAAGLFAGGAIYTYMASRLFPLWLGLAGLVLLLGDRRRWAHWLPRAVVFFGVTAAVLMPMVIYALQKPEIFFGRLYEVTQTGEAVTLWESILLHLQMFFIRGDSYFRYNIPERPYLTPPEGALMLVGLAAALVGVFRRRTEALERPAYLLALLSPLMVIPSVISVGGLPPSHMRSLGMIPLLFILCGIGAAWLWERLGAPRLRLRWLMLGVAVVLLIGVPLDWALYQGWASSAPVFYETDADLDAAGRWLIAQQQAGSLVDTDVYLGARDRGHPTVDILPVPPLTYLGTDSLFLPPAGRDGLYVFPRSAPPLDLFQRILEPGRITDGLPFGPDGRTAFEAFRLRGGVGFPADFHGHAGEPARNAYLTLLGFSAPTASPGERARVITAWRIDQPLPQSDFMPLLELIDPSGIVLARTDAYITGADRWSPGSILLQAQTLAIPPLLPPGRYALRVTWVSRGTDIYAPALYADGAQAGLWLDVGMLEVGRAAGLIDRAAAGLTDPRAVDAAPGIRLLDWQAASVRVRPGESLRYTLYWQAVDAGQPRALTAAIRLVGADGQTIQSERREPLGGRYPLERWQTGDIFVDYGVFIVPRDAPAGSAALQLDLGGQVIALTDLEIAGIPRVFDPPTPQHPLQVVFGGQIALIGYDRTWDDSGERLVLHWRALREMTVDYTLFVHRLDAAGSILDQVDTMPLGGTYPTTLWAAGEFVTEAIAFPEDARVRAYRIGWYNAETGQRIPTAADSGTDGADSVLIPVESQGHD
jgi:4-amino-4-deoxy-L-arabinose transferase-like glycosyltransferase